MKLPVLEPGCKKGTNYVNAPSYGVASSQWGHLPRGGWRGATSLLAPNEELSGVLYQGSLHGRRRYVTFKRALVWCSVDTVMNF